MYCFLKAFYLFTNIGLSSFPTTRIHSAWFYLGPTVKKEPVAPKDKGKAGQVWWTLNMISNSFNITYKISLKCLIRSRSLENYGSETSHRIPVLKIMIFWIHCITVFNQRRNICRNIMSFLPPIHLYLTENRIFQQRSCFYDPQRFPSVRSLVRLS